MNDRKANEATVDQLAENNHSHRVDAAIPVAIGSRLRKLYDDVAQEPVPDRFTDLLNQLAQSEGGRK